MPNLCVSSVHVTLWASVTILYHFDGAGGIWDDEIRLRSKDCHS